MATAKSGNFYLLSLSNLGVLRHFIFLHVAHCSCTWNLQHSESFFQLLTPQNIGTSEEFLHKIFFSGCISCIWCSLLLYFQIWETTLLIIVLLMTALCWFVKFCPDNMMLLPSAGQGFHYCKKNVFKRIFLKNILGQEAQCWNKSGPSSFLPENWIFLCNFFDLK